MAQEELAEGGPVPRSGKLKASVTADPQLQDPNQMVHGLGPSIYLSVSRRESSFDHRSDYPLYKLDVAAGSREKLGYLATNVCGKTFVSLPSGWIIGVGGRHKSDSTIIIDTKTPTSKPKVIRGPNLLSAKSFPVVVAIGSKVYSLSASPSYTTKPDFPPWFEVLDLSKGKVTETADGSLSMDGCSWEALPWPVYLPRKLTPGGYDMPPIICVRSHVVVGPYILISLNQRNSCTYAFDTSSCEWLKIDDKFLPFLGRAIPHGHSGCVFIASSLENSINAYRICVSTSSCSSSTAAAGVSGKGSAPKLSVTSLFALKNDQVVTMVEQHITSLDSGHFCVLSLWVDRRKRSLSYYSDNIEELSGMMFSKKLIAKLTTFQIDNPALLEQTQDQEELPEIAVSTLWERDFKISSKYGFSSPAISFAISI